MRQSSRWMRYGVLSSSNLAYHCGTLPSRPKIAFRAPSQLAFDALWLALAAATGPLVRLRRVW
jgi:hypothetical protein